MHTHTHPHPHTPIYVTTGETGLSDVSQSTDGWRFSPEYHQCSHVAGCGISEDKL